MNNGLYIDCSTECTIIGIRIECEIEGCHNIADEYLLSGDDLFAEAWKRIKHRELYEQYSYPKLAIGLCKKHYEEICLKNSSYGVDGER